MKKILIVGLVLLIIGAAVAVEVLSRQKQANQVVQRAQSQLGSASAEARALVEKNTFDEESQSGVRLVVHQPNQVWVFGKLRQLKADLKDFGLAFAVETKYGNFLITADNNTFFSQLTLSKPLELQYDKSSASELKDGDVVAVRFEPKEQDRAFYAIEVQKIVQ
jgi:type II secretory pathway pseudopilin PulG